MGTSEERDDPSEYPATPHETQSKESRLAVKSMQSLPILA
jgi:hypothetical protein